MSRRSIFIGGAGGGAFTDPFSGGGDEGLVEGETGAEWLEVSVISPDGDTTDARRTLFDRIGETVRTSGALDVYTFPKAEFVDLGDGAGERFLPCRAAQALFVAGATPNLRILIQELGLGGASGIAVVPAGLDGTRALVEAELAQSMGCVSFHDSPSIQALVMEPTAAGVSYALDRAPCSVRDPAQRSTVQDRPGREPSRTPGPPASGVQRAREPRPHPLALRLIRRTAVVPGPGLRSGGPRNIARLCAASGSDGRSGRSPTAMGPAAPGLATSGVR